MRYAGMIDAAIGVALGIMCLLAGFGTWQVSKNPAANATFISKWGRALKIGGVVIILAALGGLVSGLLAH